MFIFNDIQTNNFPSKCHRIFAILDSTDSSVKGLPGHTLKSEFCSKHFQIMLQNHNTLQVNPCYDHFRFRAKYLGNELLSQGRWILSRKLMKFSNKLKKPHKNPWSLSQVIPKTIQQKNTTQLTKTARLLWIPNPSLSTPSVLSRRLYLIQGSKFKISPGSRSASRAIPPISFRISGVSSWTLSIYMLPFHLHLSHTISLKAFYYQLLDRFNSPPPHPKISSLVFG